MLGSLRGPNKANFQRQGKKTKKSLKPKPKGKTQKQKAKPQTKTTEKVIAKGEGEGEGKGKDKGKGESRHDKKLTGSNRLSLGQNCLLGLCCGRFRFWLLPARGRRNDLVFTKSKIDT